MNRHAKIDDVFFVIGLLVLGLFLRFAPDLYFKVTLIALLFSLSMLCLIAGWTSSRGFNTQNLGIYMTGCSAVFLIQPVAIGLDKNPLKETSMLMIMMIIGVIVWYADNLLVNKNESETA
jgi:hypothetical protein